MLISVTGNEKQGLVNVVEEYISAIVDIMTIVPALNPENLTHKDIEEGFTKEFTSDSMLTILDDRTINLNERFIVDVTAKQTRILKMVRKLIPVLAPAGVQVYETVKEFIEEEDATARREVNDAFQVAKDIMEKEKINNEI